LRNNSCINAPANDNEAPTANADNARGIRNCSKNSLDEDGISQPTPPHRDANTMTPAAATTNALKVKK
jgi:hypothetical protein